MRSRSAFFFHPLLTRLEDSVHAKAAQALARIYGKVMPFWYAATLITTALVAYKLRPPSPASPFWFAVTAALLWLLSIVYTLIGPAPINTEVTRWNLEALPENWKERRRLWDQLHRLRIVGLIIAFVCLSVACVRAATR